MLGIDTVLSIRSDQTSSFKIADACVDGAAGDFNAFFRDLPSDKHLNAIYESREISILWYSISRPRLFKL